MQARPLLHAIHLHTWCVVTIKKLGKSKYEVVSKTGKVLGKESSRKSAAKRIAQVEYFKHHKESKSQPKSPAGAKRVIECDCLEAGAVEQEQPIIRRVKVLSWN